MPFAMPKHFGREDHDRQQQQRQGNPPVKTTQLGLQPSNENRDGYAVGFPRAGLWKTRFNSDSYNYGPNFANHLTPDAEAHEEGTDGLPCSGKISIGPYTVIILSQDE
jgi:hypothetical protein